MESKPIWKRKSTWSTLAGVIAAVLGALGYSIGPEATQQLSGAIGSVVTVACMIYGEIKRKGGD